MKPIVLIVLAVFFMAFIGGREHKSDLNNDNINGEVKTIIDSEFSAKGLLVERTISNYNLMGDILEQYVYKSNGSLALKYVQKFDTANLMIYEKGYDINDSITYIKAYKCDKNWNKIEERDNNLSIGSLERTVYILDSNKNVTEEDSYDHSGQLDSYWISKYNQYGNKIEERDYLNYSKTISYKTVYEYNKSGNCIEVSGYEADGKLHARYFCSYNRNDNAGNWLKMTRTHNNTIEYVMKRSIVYYK